MDYLIWYAGILVSIVMILLINRHIIGGVWYGFFAPIVIGWAISILDISYERAVVLIISTIIWWIITKIISNVVNFSLYPRYALYVLCSLFVFIVFGKFYITYDADQIISLVQANDLILFFVIVLWNSMKVYIWGKWFLSLTWWSHIIRFLFLSWIISIMIQSQVLHTYFMDHYGTIILLWLITILLWFYTWLQFKEILRFRRLIWSKITNKSTRTKK